MARLDPLLAIDSAQSRRSLARKRTLLTQLDRSSEQCRPTVARRIDGLTPMRQALLSRKGTLAATPDELHTVNSGSLRHIGIAFASAGPAISTQSKEAQWTG